jgi:hypothetical protein
MRTFVIMLVLVGFCGANGVANAEQTGGCKMCRDQQKACLANYSPKTCKTEYDVCVKTCGRR